MKLTHRARLALAATLALAFGQAPLRGNAASAPPPSMQQQGAVTTDDCLKSTGPNAAADSGIGCADGVVNPTSVKLGAAPVPSGTDCIGDSLSAGYCPQLAALMSGVVNNGVSGNTPFQIAARMGALPITMTSSTGYVGSSGGDVVTISDIDPVTANGPSGGVTGTWQGVHGTLTTSGGALTFTTDTVAQKAALNPAPFTIDQVRTYQRRVVWMGHNVSGQPFTTIAGTWGLVAANTPPNTQLLFLLNTYDLGSGSVPAGQFGAETKLQNNYLQRTFPNTLDPTPILQAGANASFPPDAADTANGTEPTSLRLLDGIGTLTSSITNSTTSIPITITSGSMVAGDEIVVENGTNAESLLSTATTGSTGSITATVMSRPCSSTVGSCSAALAHASGVAVYIVNVIHFDSTTDGNYIAGQAAYLSNFPAANKIGGYNLLATGVANWFTANPPATPAAPVQSTDTDGQIKASAGIVPTTTPQSILGTLAKPYESMTTNNLQVPGALKCTFSGIGGECDTTNLYVGSSLSVGGSPYATNLNTWFSCYVFSGGDYCTPVNGALVDLGTASNSFFFADLANISFFSSAISPDSAGFGSVGTASKPFGPTYSGSFISKGSHFTVSGSSAAFVSGGPTAGTFTAGTTGTNTVVVTMGGTFGATAAPTGWACHVNDLTTPADNSSWSQMAVTTTTATMAGTGVSADVMQLVCTGY
jgi:hypothetical protein